MFEKASNKENMSRFKNTLNYIIKNTSIILYFWSEMLYRILLTDVSFIIILKNILYFHKIKKKYFNKYTIFSNIGHISIVYSENLVRERGERFLLFLGTRGNTKCSTIAFNQIIRW